MLIFRAESQPFQKNIEGTKFSTVVTLRCIFALKTATDTLNPFSRQQSLVRDGLVYYALLANILNSSVKRN